MCPFQGTQIRTLLTHSLNDIDCEDHMCDSSSLFPTCLKMIGTCMILRPFFFFLEHV